MSVPTSLQALVRPVTTLRATAALVALAAWLGWVVPLLFQQVPDRDQVFTAEQILAHLQPLPLTGTGPVLLRIAPRCACNKDIPAVLPSIRAIDFHAAAARLPYPWVVLDAQRRLVYAGPALLGTGCGPHPQSAAPLVQRLLDNPQAPMIVSPSCSCQKE